MSEDSHGLVPMRWPTVTAELKDRCWCDTAWQLAEGRRAARCQPPLASLTVVLQHPVSHCSMQPLALGESRVVSHRQTNGTQGETCFKGKILYSGHFAQGKCFLIEMKWHCHSNQGATEVQPGHVQGVLRTA